MYDTAYQYFITDVTGTTRPAAAYWHFYDEGMWWVGGMPSRVYNACFSSLTYGRKSGLTDGAMTQALGIVLSLCAYCVLYRRLFTSLTLLLIKDRQIDVTKANGKVAWTRKTVFAGQIRACCVRVLRSIRRCACRDLRAVCLSPAADCISSARLVSPTSRQDRVVVSRLNHFDLTTEEFVLAAKACVA
ncbi:hypothetical protein J6590_054378 [Homalodisca vitripennis]|nr:hypothetical protein J6590_054378 [Homalodisca vitripennis]